MVRFSLSWYRLPSASIFTFNEAYQAARKKAAPKKAMSLTVCMPFRGFTCVRSYQSIQCLPPSSRKKANRARRSLEK